jgi:hypothetical protein
MACIENSDLTLSAQAVIEAYGWHFKIEVCFRTLIHLLACIIHEALEKSSKALPRDESSDLAKKQTVF